MAEFIGQPKDKIDGFSNMGKPIPLFRRQNAYEHARQMGLSADHALAAVSGIAEQLQRDKPYEAMAAGMKYVDLTGTYRLFAVLLASTQEKSS